MSKVFELTNLLIEEYRTATEGLQEAQGKVTDLYHKIEFYTEEGDVTKEQLFDALKVALTERRTCKDSLENLSRIFGDFDFVVQKYYKQKNYMENRVYTDRTFGGIF